jgi:hypothetical protein
MSNLIDFLMESEINPRMQLKLRQHALQTNQDTEPLAPEASQVLAMGLNQTMVDGLALDEFSAVNSSYWVLDPGPDPTPDPDVPTDPTVS